MAIPSQASEDEGVETRRAASKGDFSYDEGIVQRTNIPRNGSENCGVMNLEVAGSSPAAITMPHNRKHMGKRLPHQKLLLKC